MPTTAALPTDPAPTAPSAHDLRPPWGGSSITTIAWATMREALRGRSAILLLVIYAIGVALSKVVAWISATDGRIITGDLVFTLQSLIGVLVAVAVGSSLVQVEITQRTLYTVLTRPLPRWQFVLGKFLGLIGALAVMQVAMLVVGLVWLWLMVGVAPTWFLVLAGAMVFLEVAVMAAVSLCWTSLSSPLLSAVLSLATYALGHAVASLPSLIHHLNPIPGHWSAQGITVAAMSSLVPNLGRFTYREDAVYGHPPTMSELWALPYALAWIALLVVITVSVLRRKQL